MNERNLIGNFLEIDGFDDFKNDGRLTTLSIAVRGARHLCGRELDSGIRKSKEEIIDKTIDEGEKRIIHSSQFLGLTNYLIILDLIGSLFQTKSNKRKGDNIELALSCFSSLNENHIVAIKVLRNSLAHHFGLGNDTHIFSISQDYKVAIELPDKANEWNRTRTVKAESNFTKINDVLLCDFIESVIQKLNQEFANDNLSLRTGIDENTLKSKFTIK
jgi:hypothetical protein